MKKIVKAVKERPSVRQKAEARAQKEE